MTAVKEALKDLNVKPTGAEDRPENPEHKECGLHVKQPKG